MFQIISDGSCDFSNEEVKKYNVDIVPFYISFDEVTYLKEGIDIHKEEYFNKLINDKNLFPKTSQPNPNDYIEFFTPYLKNDTDIVCLTISSKLSGSYNSAVIAIDTLKEEYPKRNIVLIDSLSASLGQGLILREIIKMRDVGIPVNQVKTLAEKVIKTTKIYFTLDTLEYLKKGGRIGPTSALVGGLLNLKPILHVVNGEVTQFDSVRGKKNVIKKIEEGLIAVLKGDSQYINLSIGHICSESDAITLKSNVENALNTKIDTPLVEVGATVGTHVGPGAIAFAYCKSYENV